MVQAYFESRLRGKNLAPFPITKQPATFAVRWQPDAPKVLLSKDSIAHWCRSVGTQTDIYTTSVRLRGDQQVAVEFTPAPPTYTPTPFQNIHGVSALKKLLLSWEVDNVAISKKARNGVLTAIETGPGRQVWYERYSGIGFVSETWYYLYPWTRAIDYESHCIYSDRKASTWSRPATLTVKSESFFVIDQAPEQGFGGERSGELPHNLKNESFGYICNAERFGEGQGPRIKGTILPLPSTEANESGDDIQTRVNRAAFMVRGWSDVDSWGNDGWFGSAPFVDARKFGVDSRLAPLYENRRAGMAMNAGQTGMQNDFGTLPICPQSIDDFLKLEIGCTSHLRGFMHYESDGTMLLARNHPGWEVWGDRCHQSGTYFLDKNGMWTEADYSGMMGFDWQHLSQNSELAILAATGDYSLEAMFRHHLEAHMASKWGYYYDAQRALGRRLQNFVNADMVVPDHRYEELSLGLCIQASQKSPGRDLPPDRPCRFLWLGGDYPAGVTDPVNGAFWEAGIAAAGAYRAWKRWGSPEQLWVAQEMGRTTAAAFWVDGAGNIRTSQTARFEFPGHITGTKWPQEVLENGPISLSHSTELNQQNGWYVWFVAGLRVFLAVPLRDNSEAEERTAAAATLLRLLQKGVGTDAETGRLAVI